MEAQVQQDAGQAEVQEEEFGGPIPIDALQVRGHSCLFAKLSTSCIVYGAPAVKHLLTSSPYPFPVLPVPSTSRTKESMPET